MTLFTVIARSEATKQSRFPTLRVGECVGEANSRISLAKRGDCHGFLSGSLAMTEREKLPRPPWAGSQ